MIKYEVKKERLITLAVFHDIGVYKIEKRDYIVDIDLETPMNYSVNGYLFIKYFSHLSDLASIVLGNYLYPKDFSSSAEIKIPKEAVSINVNNTEDVKDYNKEEFELDADKLLNFIKLRRSLRHFKNKDIQMDKISRIIEAERFTQIGWNLQNVFNSTKKKT